MVNLESSIDTNPDPNCRRSRYSRRQRWLWRVRVWTVDRPIKRCVMREGSAWSYDEAQFKARQTCTELIARCQKWLLPD